jgi:CheY-like chemotaxis protein
MNGYEVLREIKKDPHLGRIPVVILTSLPNEENVLRSYDLHADCYITKPIGLNQIAAVVRSIEDFRLTIVELPITGFCTGVRLVGTEGWLKRLNLTA